LADQGLDAGAHTIAFHLERRHGSSPAPSTIWRILTRRGFVTPQPQKRPRSSFIRFEAEMPNGLWQADVTHWELAHETEAEILNIVDDHSRLCVASDARAVTKGGDVVASFHGAFAMHGFPASVLTDNAAVFAGGPRGGGRCAIEVELDQLGVAHKHSAPYHPQICGKVERFHQTEKRWLAKQPKAQDLDELEEQIDRFRTYYNAERPHRALRRRTPLQAFQARPSATPRSPRVRRSCALPGAQGPRRRRGEDHPSLQEPTAARRAGTSIRPPSCPVLVADLHVRVLTEDGELIRDLVLDPSRTYQPQG
jgi:transposase InsO family protein